MLISSSLLPDLCAAFAPYARIIANRSKSQLIESDNMLTIFAAYVILMVRLNDVALTKQQIK